MNKKKAISHDNENYIFYILTDKSTGKIINGYTCCRRMWRRFMFNYKTRRNSQKGEYEVDWRICTKHLYSKHKKLNYYKYTKPIGRLSWYQSQRLLTQKSK